MLVSTPGHLRFELISAASAAQTIPKLLNYQARITSATGTALADGSISVKFTIYDASASGTCRYTTRGSCGTPTGKNVTVTNGVFSTLLGDTVSGDNAIPDDLFDTPTLYLGITVATDSEMTPRKRLSAAPWAFNADRLDNLDTSATGGVTAYIPVTSATGSLTLSAALNVTGTGTFGNLVVNGTCTGCGGAADTLQSAYNASTSPELTLDAVRGALTIRDASTPLGTANLFEIKDFIQNTTHFLVSATGVRIGGGNLDTTAATFNIASTATTINLAAAATTINLGGGSGSTGCTVDGSGNYTCTADGAFNGGDITTTATTATLFNATATTVSVGGAATTFNMAGGSGSTGCTIDGSGNLSCSGTVTGGGGATTLQTAYDSSTGTTEIFLGSARGALTLADSFNSFGGNLFEIQNRVNGAGDYSRRYFTVSSTNTAIGSASNTYSITPNARFAGNLAPTADNVFDLGDYNLRWRELWLGGGSANIAYDASGTSILQLGWETTEGMRAKIMSSSQPLQITPDNGLPGMYMDKYGRMAVGKASLTPQGGTFPGWLEIDSGSSTLFGVVIKNPSGMIRSPFVISSSSNENMVSVDRTGTLFAMNSFQVKALLGDTDYVYETHTGPYTNQFRPRNLDASAVTIDSVVGMGADDNLIEFGNADHGIVYTRFDRMGRLIFGATNTDPLALVTIATSTAVGTPYFLDIRNLTSPNGDYSQRYLTVSATGTQVTDLLVTGTCTGCGGGSLQTAYNASTDPEITLDATRGALTLKDAASPIGANLLEVIGVNPDDGSAGTRFFTASSTSTTIGNDILRFPEDNSVSSEIIVNGGGGTILHTTGSVDTITFSDVGSSQMTFGNFYRGLITDSGLFQASGGDVFGISSSADGTSGSSLLNLTNIGTHVAGSALLEMFTNTQSGLGLSLSADLMTAGTGMNMTFNGLTSGKGVSIASTSTGLTSGSLLTLTTATTGAVVTNGIVEFEATGAFTSGSNVGLLNLKANSTQTGTIQNITGTSLTSGTALNIVGGGANMTSTGNTANISMGAATVGHGLHVTSTGAYVGSGDDGILEVESTSTGTTGHMLYVKSLTTGNVSNGLVRFQFQGDHTGLGFQIVDFSTTSATVMRLNANNLTTGVGIQLNTTGLTATGSSLTIDGGATGRSLTFAANGAIIDFSSTAGNTMVWRLPTKSSGTCASGVAEGIRFLDAGGTQRGHACIDSGTPLLKFYANQFNTASTDLAEMYSTRAKDGIVAGDVVALDPSGDLMVKKSSGAYAPDVIGIISDAPGLALSGVDEATGAADTVNGRYVALKGRVPTKVSNENGPIEVGDRLTASSIAGVAMKATKPGMIVGRALDAWKGPGQGMIRVFIEVGWYSGNGAAEIASPAAPVPPPVALTLSPAAAPTFAAAIPTLSASGTPSLFAAASLISTEGLWSISADGRLVARKVETKLLKTEEVMVVQSASATVISEGVVPKNKTSVVIKNGAMKKDSKIFVSFLADSNGNYWITDKGDGVFTLRVKTAPKKDLPFEYWIVSVDDQRPKPVPAK